LALYACDANPWIPAAASARARLICYQARPSFHDFERTNEHHAFLGWLIDTLKSNEIDALLVSGDVYDTANPSSQSQKMLNTFIKNAHLEMPHLQMIITGGNHDSGSRLEGPKVLAEAFNASILGNLPVTSKEDTFVIDWDKSIFKLKNKEGKVEALVGAVPFVRPAEWSVFRAKAEENYESQDYSNCMKSLYEELFEKMQGMQSEGEKLIAMGHLTLSGGSISELSERRLVIGGEESLSSSIFNEGFDYVALGHLHKAQKVGRESIRYSGSPLPLSYSEKNYKHQVVIIDTEKKESFKIIQVPRKIELLSIPGKALPKEEALIALSEWQPQIQSENPEEWPYLIVPVSLTKADPNLMVDIQEAVKFKPLRLCHIAPEFPELNKEDIDLQLETSAGLKNLNPTKIFNHVLQRSLSEEELENKEHQQRLSDAFAEVLEESRHFQKEQP
jgi:exonuclease SbcD